jgi:hypothetical protein
MGMRNGVPSLCCRNLRIEVMKTKGNRRWTQMRADISVHLRVSAVTVFDLVLGPAIDPGEQFPWTSD